MKWVPSLSIRRLEEILLQEQSRWILWFPVAMGAGIVSYFSLPFEPFFWPAPLFCLVCSGLWLLSRKQAVFYFFASLCFSVSLGFTAAQVRTHLLSTFLLTSPLPVQNMEGTLIQIEKMPKNIRLTLDEVKLQDSRLSRPLQAIRLTVRGTLVKSATGLYPGQRLRLDAVLLPPNEPVAPGAYDFRRRSYFSGISAVGFATSSPQILKENPLPLALKLARFRHQVTTRLQEGIGDIEGAIAAGLVTGDRAGIPENIRQAFADSGLAHILAISGLHLSIVAGLAFLCLRRGLSLFPLIALRYPVKKWAAGAALVLTFGYLLLSGLSIPAQRAFIMTSIVLLGVLTDRVALTLRNVSLAASLILLFLPESLMSPSFQMSFAAVIALVAGYEALRHPLTEWQVRKDNPLRRLSLYLFGISVSTILATAATTPYVAYTFHRFTLHAIPANLLSIPLLTFMIMPLLVIFLFLSRFGLESLVAYPLKPAIGGLIQIALEVSSWPGSVLLVRAMPPLALGLFTLGALWLALWQTRWRWGGWAGIAACGGLMTIGRPPDLYVSAEKKLVVFTGNNAELWTNSLRSGRFARESWMKMAAAKKCETFKKLSKRKERKAFSSTKEGYLLHTAAANVLLQEEKESFSTDWSCRLIHQAAQQTLDSERLVEKGGHLIWIKPQGFEVQTVADWVGNRPWCLRWMP